MGIFYLIKQKRKVWRAKRGTGHWGREPGSMSVSSVQAGTISARVIRADGSIEDLGVIAETERGE